jgi:nucleoside-diphosphate-sugar epimerase
MSTPLSLQGRRIAVTGATGAVGVFLLPRLLASGAQVLALSREPPAGPRHPRLQWISGDLATGAFAQARFDTLLSAGPLDLLARGLDRAWPQGLVQVIALSSTSIDSKRDSPLPEERALAGLLVEAETVLIRACDRHGARSVRIRPTLIYGAGRDRSLTPLAARVRRFRVLPLPWPARGLRQPVHAEDLAALMQACIDRGELAGRCLEAGGGERLPLAAMLRRTARAVAPLYLPLPLPARLLRWVLPARAGALARLDVDLLADNAEVQRLLQWRPRPFHPEAVDFQNRTVAYVSGDDD